MASSYVFQIFLRVTVQNQIRIAQRIVVDEVVQFRPLRHGHVQSNSSSTPVQPMEIFLPSWRVNSTHPVSMLNLQALSSYFIIASSNSRYRLTVYDKASEFCAVHGSLHCCTRRKRKIRTLLQSETGSDFSCLVGAGGFEPPKLKSSRFTVCPHWPLGNTPIYSFSQSRTACIYYHSGAYLSTAFYSFFRKEADRTAQSRGRP